MLAPIISITKLAPASDRDLKVANGTSGAFARSSMTTKAAIRMPASTSGTIVAGEPHAWELVWTTA